MVRRIPTLSPEFNAIYAAKELSDKDVHAAEEYRKKKLNENLNASTGIIGVISGAFALASVLVLAFASGPIALALGIGAAVFSLFGVLKVGTDLYKAYKENDVEKADIKNRVKGKEKAIDGIYDEVSRANTPIRTPSPTRPLQQHVATQVPSTPIPPTTRQPHTQYSIPVTAPTQPQFLPINSLHSSGGSISPVSAGSTPPKAPTPSAPPFSPPAGYVTPPTSYAPAAWYGATTSPSDLLRGPKSASVGGSPPFEKFLYLSPGNSLPANSPATQHDGTGSAPSVRGRSRAMQLASPAPAPGMTRGTAGADATGLPIASPAASASAAAAPGVMQVGGGNSVVQRLQAGVQPMHPVSSVAEMAYYSTTSPVTSTRSGNGTLQDRSPAVNSQPSSTGRPGRSSAPPTSAMGLADDIHASGTHAGREDRRRWALAQQSP